MMSLSDPHLAHVVSIYSGSDGGATRALYQQLEARGPLGVIAVNLLRAQKNSARAKVYRGGERGRGSYRRMAYDRKQWAIEQLAKALLDHAHMHGMCWGWGIDLAQEYHNVVLYIDLPTGQVSFHTDRRSVGPDYPKQWDGKRDASPQRIWEYAAQLIRGDFDAGRSTN